jgi:ribonuclease HI
MSTTAIQSKTKEKTRTNKKHNKSAQNANTDRSNGKSIVQTKINQFMKLQKVAQKHDINKHHMNTNPSTSKIATQTKLWQYPQIEIPDYDNGTETFGDELQSDNQSEIFYFHNINGIKSDDNWAQILLTLSEHRVTGFGIAETNTSFAHPSSKEYLKKLRHTFKHSRCSSSERVSNHPEKYKPGGTLTAVIGKWQARVTSQGDDPNGLGRWSFIRISSKHKNLVIATAYRPIKTNGISTNWMQQWLLLRQRGNPSPDPISEFYKDLGLQIKQWISQGYELILMIDANESIGTRTKGLTEIMVQYNLSDLISIHHGTTGEPNTHLRGSKRIDYILGTRKVREHCTASGILPFHNGYSSDHRPIYAAINLEKVLSDQITNLESQATRLISKSTPRERIKLLDLVDEHYNAHNIYERLHRLASIPIESWQQEHNDEYEACDEQHIIGLVAAEKKACRPKPFPWSPLYREAANLKSVWKVLLSRARTNTKLSAKALNWVQDTLKKDMSELPDIRECQAELRKAQKRLKSIKQQANELRIEFLLQSLNIATAESDDAREKAIRNILQAQNKLQSFSRIRQIFRPRTHGGISRILIPTSQGIDQWETVTDQEQMQNLLRQQNIKHFGLAHGTPFTCEPLIKLNWEANSKEADMLINGEMPEAFDQITNKYTRNLLEYIRNMPQLPEIDCQFTPDEVATGFRKWRESTSTSPSGCHLGLRRVTSYAYPEEETEKMKQEILKVQTHVINIPLKHGFSPNRWRKVVNAVIEKVPNKPYIHKLRIIHLLEADYNLCLKAIFGRKLTWNCEEHGTLGDIQNGFRPGRSTMGTIIMNELITEYNRRMRMNFYIIMTDISGCFDRIIPSIISLLNRKNGLSKQAVQMHGNTLRHAKYHLKTKFGISQSYYSHSEDTPIYGNGQGAGDSPSQWNQESAILISLFSKQASNAKIIHPVTGTCSDVSMTAFADDTTIHGNDHCGNKTKLELIDNVQNDLTCWNEYLHAAGHLLELTKCACYMVIWNFDNDGQPTILCEDHDEKIKIQIRQRDNSTVVIPQLSHDTGQKTLGVMKCPSGSQQPEIERLREKSDAIARRLILSGLTRKEARLAYETSYIPAMRYSLATTSIHQVDLEKIQQRATSAFLTKMGYNRNMPREVVFGHQLYQGLSLRHLFDIQGIDGITTFIQEINSNGKTKSVLAATIQALQIEAGIGKSIFEQTEPLPHVDWSWLMSIRDFLEHINAEIRGVPVTITPLCRRNDKYIMEAIPNTSFSPREIRQIQAVRLHLQVTVLSDITDATGVRVSHEWLYPKYQRPESLWKWPHQECPPKHVWATWRRFLTSTFTNEAFVLQNPLGPWIEIPPRKHSILYDNESKRLLISDQGTWTVHRQFRSRRRTLEFDKQAIAEAHSMIPTTNTVPIDVIRQTDNIIVTNIPQPRITETHQASLTDDRVSKIILEQYPRWRHLHNSYRSIMDDHLAREAILAAKVVYIATDGGYEPRSGISSYGWVIASSDSMLITGKGPAEAHPTMANSFRSEGYGAASALLFITAYCKAWDLPTSGKTWKLLIDNKAMVDRLNEHKEAWKRKGGKYHIRPEADITKVTDTLLRGLDDIQIMHIKGHQDSRNPNNITWEAQLNITADSLATEHRWDMMSPAVEVSNTTDGMLVIEGKAITRDINQQLWQEASKLPIREYYKERYGWSHQLFDKINWKAQQAALIKFSTQDQQRILKFVHKWLPTGRNLQREQQSQSPNCPLCRHALEDNLHIFNCPHPEQMKLQHELLLFLAKQRHDKGMPDLIQILEWSLAGCSGQDEWTIDTQYYPESLHEAIQEQNEIGWQHLFYGRMSAKFEQAQEQHYRWLQAPEMTHNGKRWARLLIQQIWKTTMALWKNRNMAKHDNDDTTNSNTARANLIARARICYENVHWLSASDQNLLFNRSLEDRIQSETQNLQAWVEGTEQIIRISRQEDPHIIKSRKKMEEFLQKKKKATQKSH